MRRVPNGSLGLQNLIETSGLGTAVPEIRIGFDVSFGLFHKGGPAKRFVIVGPAGEIDGSQGVGHAHVRAPSALRGSVGRRAVDYR